MKVKTKSRKRKGFTQIKNVKTSQKLRHDKKMNKKLDVVKVRWVPIVQPLGKLLDGRYFVMKKLNKSNFWLCWDLKDEKEITINTVIKPCYSKMNFTRNDYFDNLKLNMEDKAMNLQEDSEISQTESNDYLKTHPNNMEFKPKEVYLNMEDKPMNLQEECEMPVVSQYAETNLKSNDCLANVHSNMTGMDPQNEPMVPENSFDNPCTSDMNLEPTECLENFNLNMNNMFSNLQKEGDLTVNTSQDLQTNLKSHEEFPKSKINIGDLLNERYYVLAELYNGIMSTVVLCWDMQRKRDVVVKIPREDKDNLAMVATEIKMLRQLHAQQPPDPRQQNVIQIYDDFCINTSVGLTPCIVIEVLDGTLLDLAKKSQHDSLPLAIVKNITRQMLMGLDYLHCFNIVHTDIKPENVLYSSGNGSLEDLRVKIADLGNACYEDDPVSWEIQTPAYRCIEAILDVGYTTTADIWSVACVSFELATGKYLFGIRPENVPNRDEFHVASIIEHLRYIPLHLILRGRKSPEIFDKYGQLLNLSDHRNSIKNVLLNTYFWSPIDAHTFASFLEYLLELDPDKRPSAAECLKHPWLN